MESSELFNCQNTLLTMYKSKSFLFEEQASISINVSLALHCPPTVGGEVLSTLRALHFNQV